MRRDALFHPAGSLRDLYEALDWSATSVGPVSGWSQTLVGAVDLVLHTSFPVTLLWGPEFTMVYNEAYVALIADKHPAALGAPAQEVFPEAWGTVGPLLDHVRAGRGAVWFEDSNIPLDRRGFLEECRFTFSYSAVRGEDGTIEGVIDISAESTRQVLDRRRLGLLGRLAEALADLEHVEDVRDRALPVLREASDDLPLVDLRLTPSSRDPALVGRLPGRPSIAFGSARGLLLEETRAGRVAWLPLAGPDAPGSGPVLVVLLNEMLAPDDAYLGFLRLIATSLSQALDRIGVREAERAVAAAEQGLSEALQRSVLTPPAEPDHLQVAVRYRPAAQQAKIGGDWYDSFLLEDGMLTLVIGDVAGHDRAAAAGMAQLRNLLRGVASTLEHPPARLLAGLDRAMRTMTTEVFATAVVAQVEQAPELEGTGERTLRWSNAGHPPPVLLAADGSTRLLEGTPDPVLGVGHGARADHTVALHPEASVIFFTDGLVERRGVPLDESLAWLTDLLAGHQARSAEELCDLVMDALGDWTEDDVALMVLKAGREDVPRPDSG